VTAPAPAGKAAAGITDPAVRAAFHEWLLRAADDELMIGHRHSEWTGVGPDIESDVAMSSIAQEELGHARLFYEQIAGDEPAACDRLAFGRAPGAYRNAVLLELPNAGWEFSIVRLALYEAFEGLRLGLLAACGQEPVAGLAATLGREERYHGLFAATWLERLAGTSGDTPARARVQQALDEAWPYALGFFETTPADDVLLGAGLLTEPAGRQRGTWEAAVRPLLARCGLTVPAVAQREGGRRGDHTDALAQLHRDMTEVWRSDPEARW
jgi:ring-1,2-phenylacetyl-CoA epoxidase subunit PaaC